MKMKLKNIENKQTWAYDHSFMLFGHTDSHKLTLSLKKLNSENKRYNCVYLSVLDIYEQDYSLEKH